MIGVISFKFSNFESDKEMVIRLSKSKLRFLNLILILLFSMGLIACKETFKSTSLTPNSPVQTPNPDPAPDPDPTPDPTPNPTERVITFTTHQNAIHNPERGFHQWIEWGDAQSVYTGIRSSGSSLGILVVRLDAYRNSAISSEFLTGLTTRFGYAKTAGLKLILKFSYNEGPYPNTEPDASESRILAHIAQLKPVLAANAEAIAFVQTGFIGAWGEWHSSTNNLVDFESNPNSARNILDAVLDALPQGLFAQLRYPRHKVHFYDDVAITTQEAFTATAKARIGHHNDCFLASSTDHSTYTPMDYNENQIELWKNYIGSDGRYTPIGGETCENASFSDCPAALIELARQRYTYLNLDYHPAVISKWQSNSCYAEIARRLGYRLALSEIRIPSFVERGSAMTLNLKLNNSGFASPMNPRPMYIVLRGTGGTRVNIPVPATDVRRWLPGNIDTATVVTIPANTAPGIYELSLWMPDPNQSLQSRPEYSIQLANTGVWNATLGLNVLATDFEVQ